MLGCPRRDARSEEERDLQTMVLELRALAEDSGDNVGCDDDDDWDETEQGAGADVSSGDSDRDSLTEGYNTRVWMPLAPCP